MNIEKLSGLDFIRNILKGRISPRGISEVIVTEVIEVTRGYIKFYAKADKGHRNPLGGVHSGFAAMVMDSVTACAIRTMLEAGIGFATLDLNTKIPLRRSWW